MSQDLEGLAARELFIENLNSKDKSNTRVKNTKYTAILAHQICEHVSKGIPMRQAAQALGISESTFHRWRREKDDFAEMIDQAIGVSESRLITEISVNEDWRAKAWILERRFPERWSKREQIDMNVSKSEGLEEIKLMMKQTDHLLGINKGEDGTNEDPNQDED
jgi:AraC-like DNA-binding protein